MREKPDVLQSRSRLRGAGGSDPSRVSIAPSTTHVARLGQQQPIDQLEDRGLAGAAASDEGNDLAGIDRQS